MKGWNIAAETFLTSEFVILGEPVTGKKLLEWYYRIKTPTPLYATAFLVKLFPKKIGVHYPGFALSVILKALAKERQLSTTDD